MTTSYMALLLEEMDTVTVAMPIKCKAQDAPTEQSAEDSQDEYEVKALTDTELREQLFSYGISPGPILPSTRAVYEKKLLRLMKICPRAAAVKEEVGNSEKDGEKAGTGEVVFESDSLECTPGLDNLQEILPEGKGTAHRFQGQRRKFASSPERNPGQKAARIPCEDYGNPDANVTEGTSTKRRAVTSNPPSGLRDPEIKHKVVPETPEKGFLSRRAKIALFAIFVFLTKSIYPEDNLLKNDEQDMRLQHQPGQSKNPDKEWVFQPAYQLCSHSRFKVAYKKQ
ncbi:LEM domain-containing protein 1 [Tiliqua scincoides]|uniref:LEM domain-containing protein 1 n=1 Tax=Tiliqua scincoides TaxID=71010 RepID=UPI003462F8C5